jgi:hypothetical protein
MLCSFRISLATAATWAPDHAPCREVLEENARRPAVLAQVPVVISGCPQGSYPDVLRCGPRTLFSTLRSPRAYAPAVDGVARAGARPTGFPEWSPPWPPSCRRVLAHAARQVGQSAGEPPLAATAVFGVVVGVRPWPGRTVDAFGGAAAAGARRAGLPGTLRERCHQAVKILSTAVDGAPGARQDVNGRVGVADTFRVLVHDHIAALELLHRTVARGCPGWGAQRRDAAGFPGDTCYRTRIRRALCPRSESRPGRPAG